VVDGPAVAGPWWAGKGRGEGIAARWEKEKREARRTLRAWARGPEAFPLLPFLFPFKPLSKLDSNLNADSNLKSHSNKFQIKPKELQVSHANIFIFPRDFI
jgi:hypothetical protein